MVTMIDFSPEFNFESLVSEFKSWRRNTRSLRNGSPKIFLLDRFFRPNALVALTRQH